jgi:SAM-dependent methyltransferase
MPPNFEEYVGNLQLKELLHKLGSPNPDTLANTVRHFTIKEAERRDEIVTSYFGQSGIDRIVKTVADHLLEEQPLSSNAKILDIGAGTGFFTARIAKRIHARKPKASFYAMDLTPAMLLSLAKKNVGITPFVGIAENIKGSTEYAGEYFKIPLSFDAIFSTLMLHHSTEPERVFGSIKAALKKNGEAIVVDLCEHGFEEFKTEMGDVHLGFKPEKVHEMARKHFSDVKVEKMPGISCECSGRVAEIFVAYMRN